MKTMFRMLVIVLFISVTGGLSIAFANDPLSYNIDFQIQLRSNVSVKMGAVVVINPRNPNNGLQVLTLNGTGQTANTFVPLAQAVFSDNFGGLVSKMVLLNYPGHGNSGYPVGIQFGDLNMADYVTSLLASIDKLTPLGL